MLRKIKGKNYPFFTKIGIAILYSFARLVCRPVFHGLKNIPEKGPFVLIGNHQRFFDVMLIHLEMPQNPRWLSKEELSRYPVVRQFLESLHTIPVDRQGLNLKAVKEVLRSLKEGQIIAIFPEGTRVPYEDIGNIMPKDGVVSLLSRAGVPIVPFAINTPYRLFRKNDIFFGEPFTLTREDGKKTEETKALIMHKIYGQLKELPPQLEGKYEGCRDGRNDDCEK